MTHFIGSSPGLQFFMEGGRLIDGHSLPESHGKPHRMDKRKLRQRQQGSSRRVTSKPLPKKGA